MANDHSFPPPKIFTNALLSHHDITSLIRDTEAHERALFSVPPPPPPSHAPKRSAPSPSKKPAAKRRQTVFNVTTDGEVTTGGPSTRGGSAAQPRKHTAVAAVLGGEMHERLRKGELDRKGDIDVEVLLRGAETLCGVYELPGARERIASLRAKYRNGRDTAAYYEGKVAEQGEQLASMDKNWMEGEEEEDEDGGDDGFGGGGEILTEEDLKREEDEAREMETKKRELQARLRTMEKDLGGLMHM